ncbi:MAG: uroporphyrinogen decarboxylase family protein [Oscillospiraceae bacterium]|jgi:uroporphyrinogen decarboxylase|nr:uroporphyrinogen decarboxylase family protein [Oscillospiraceae bacterium]
MDMQIWLNNLLKAPVKKAMPVLSFPCVSLMGITVRELIGSSDLQAKGMKLIADRADSAASVSMMDLSVEAEAFGCAIRLSDHEVPTVTGVLIGSEADAEALRVPAVGAGRTGRYIEAIQKASELIADRPVFAGVIGPFSLAGRLMDVTEALVNCYSEPDMVHICMKKTTAFLIEYIKAYKNTGAGGVVIAEPLTGLLSPALAEEFSEPYVQEIVKAVQDNNFIVIYHNCGNNTVLMADSILRTGASAYHFGNAIDMRDMLTHMPSDIVVMGNVDPAGQFKDGTPQFIYDDTLRVMNACCHDYPNFVISSGCDIPPAASWENIDAFFSAVKAFYANPAFEKNN